MSNTFVAETSDDRKTDNTLIIIVNNDGTISVDQETLQNILANQQNTAVSVVRVGGPSQGDDSSQDSNGTCDSQNDGNPHINLTVEGFYPPAVSSDAGSASADITSCASTATPVAAAATTTTATATSPTTSTTSTTTVAATTAVVAANVDMVADMVPPTPGAVSGVNAVPAANSAEGESLDPFLEMDPEQLERLETALQSEQAKQILGENVTAMLDMLTVEEEATQLKDSILMDHCYTNRSPSTAPAAPSAVAPAVTQQYTASSGREDSGSVIVHQGDHIQQVVSSGMGPPVVQAVVRGRGRGRPGRPRREGSSTRGATSLRGMTRGGLGRGGVKIQRGGTIVSGSGSGNMIMVQQIKQITPPLSAAGGTAAVGATMVPVVRPLVISTPSGSGQLPSGTVVRAPVTGQVQKQIITVPQGARLVAVHGKSGSGDAVGQQAVLLTSASGQVVQAQQLQGVTSVSSQLSNTSNAKVVVAKMPPILPPHQFLGAQPTTSPLTEQPAQRVQKEDESDFTDFPQEASEESESEESDVGSDDEYRDPSVGRRGGRGSKGRGRFGRGGRSRGGYRVYESNRGGRGGRRGRGRGFARAEDMDRVKKLDAEMAGFVAAMEKSPERLSTHNEKASHQETREKHVKKEDNNFPADSSPLESSKKRLLKVYGKGIKKIPEVGLEDVHVKTESTGLKEKIEKSPPLQLTPEKKSPVLKSPVKRHSPEIPVAIPVATPVTPVTTTTPPAAAAAAAAAAATEARKNYPKRENRKPPAHLAEALGPALFSTPDIIRRVSTGADQKTAVECGIDEKKETKPVGVISSLETVAEEKVGEHPSEVAEKGLQNVSSEVVQEVADQAVIDSLQPDPVKTEDLLDQTIVKEEPQEDRVIDSSSPVLKTTTGPESASAVSQETSKPRTQIQLIVKPASLKPQLTLAVKRSSRRRSSSSSVGQQSETTCKKEGSKQSIAGTSKDKKRTEEIKQKGRRRISEVDEDDDEDGQSSDDESWNSEDDPDRLWCICKKPHNNRFMICCDVCEDWFHGKCVGVTKAMGQQMENKGLEWSCPNCAKKKEGDEKESKKIVLSSPKEKEMKKTKENKKEIPGRATDTVHPDVKESSGVGSEGMSQQGSSSDAQIMYCIVCKKEARPSSIYCGDACILKHAQESLNVISRDKVTPGSSGGAGGRDVNQDSQPSQQQSVRGVDAGQSGGASSAPSQPIRTRPDARVIVYERKTGVLLAGPNAPTAGNLKTWLKDNPTFEVVRPGLMPTKLFGPKTQGTKTVIVQSSKLPHQKPIVQQLKGIHSHTSISVATPPKLGATQKIGAVQQRTVLLQQKLPTGLSKPAANTQKIVATVSSPVKVLPSKVQKGPVVVSPQPQKIVIKASPKQPSIPAKTTVKNSASSTTSFPKVPVSPSNKTAPASVVSKAPATSTVKESAKLQMEKPIPKKVEVKRQSSTSSETGKKEEEKEKEKEKPSGPEPIRLNVRKTLQELLQARIQECSDLDTPETEVQSIAVNIEEEMHSFFRDTGIKYKSKYRSLVFNIKDRKNLTLFRKIVDKSLTPHQLVRLSPEELASQELAQWREREAKHQLEMIKKNELDLMSQAKTYVMKTHKGEQVIETDETLKVEVPELVDPSAVPDLVSPINNSVSSTVEDTELDKVKIKTKDKDIKEKSHKEEKERNRDREKSRHDDKRRDKSEKSRRDDKDRRESHHERHDREKRKENKEREKGKSSSRDKHRSSDKSKRDSDRHRDSKSSSNSRKDKKEDSENKKEDVIKKESSFFENIEEKSEKESDNLFCKSDLKDETDTGLKTISSAPLKMEPQEDSDLSDREPSSTVIIKTPDINIEDHEKNVNTTVWKGFVHMPDVAKFFTTVHIVSGDPQNLGKELPDTVDIVGRIAPETVWEYISKMKKTGTKEILVLRLTAANEEEKIQYITLYTYLNTRGRLGVVGNVSKMIKDFYIMPLASHLPVPQILLPLVGPGFEEYRPHLLIGILVRARRKRLAPENEYVAKMPKRVLPIVPPISSEPVERSYTPPLPGTETDMIGSLTPPHPPPSHTSGNYTPPSSPQAFLGTSSLHNKSTDPRLSRMDKDVLQDDFSLPEKSVASNKPSLASHVGQYGGDDDDDAPYSPGGSDDDVESSEDNMMVSSKNPVELQRKVEELNRKIEEQKQQIESISCAIVASDPSVAALGTVSESIKVNSMMQNYIIGPSEETGVPENGDENEAYSPSRSFTPPSTSIPFIGPAEAGSSPVFTKLTSNINLPSNLHEILATIKKQESDKAAGSKGINLKSDPIVQNYSKTSETAEMETTQPKTPREDFSNADASIFSTNTVVATGMPTVTSPPPSASVLQSASSALLSLSTPVVHPLASGGSVVSTSVSSKVVESKISRDPRQRGSETLNKSSGSTLSTLSDDDLIKKALEMEMEMTEPKINTGITVDQNTAVTIPTLQKPLTSGVDSVPTMSGTIAPAKASIVSKSISSGQPLPPGIEDEEYPSYSSFGVTSQSTVIPPMSIPVPSVPYNIRSNSPAPYRVPHSYPGTSYSLSPARVPPQSPGYSSSFPPPPPPPPPPPVGYTANVEDSSTAPNPSTKRKFSEVEGDESIMKRDRSDSPNSGSREAWDSKVPVPVRGRFSGNGSGRGRGFVRGGTSQRGFVRLRGGTSRPPVQTPVPNRSRWDSKDNDRKRSSRYDPSRSDWEAHNKDFDDKHRDRGREGHHRDRSREKEKPSSSQRSHSARNNRSRDNDKGSDSP